MTALVRISIMVSGLYPLFHYTPLNCDRWPKAIWHWQLQLASGNQSKISLRDESAKAALAAFYGGHRDVLRNFVLRRNRHNFVCRNPLNAKGIPLVDV